MSDRATARTLEVSDKTIANEVGRFISRERLINESRETYYDALKAAGHGWHEDGHDIKPWLSTSSAYKEFETVSESSAVREPKEKRSSNSSALR